MLDYLSLICLNCIFKNEDNLIWKKYAGLSEYFQAFDWRSIGELSRFCVENHPNVTIIADQASIGGLKVHSEK